MNGNNTGLNDQQFRALVHLLDDEDPEVSRHVWSQLTDMGADAVSRLEAEWERLEDPAMQKAVEDAIHRLQLMEVTNDLLEWRKGGGKDLLQGWFLLSRFQFPDLELRRFSNEVNRLVNKTWLEMSGHMSPEEQIQVINHILFRMEGYGPNNARPNHPHNSFLNYLVEQQQGNVMSLSMLYLIICKQLDLPVHGVLLPGYFVLLYKDHAHEFYIDVFNGGKIFDRERLEHYLKQVHVEAKPSYFKPTSNIYIILNLLQLVSSDFGRSGRQDKVDDIQQLLEDIDIRFPGT